MTASRRGTPVSAAAWLADSLDTRLVIAQAFDPMGIPARPRREMHARGLTEDDLEDVEPHSLRAARHGATLAARLGRELLLLHVTTGVGVKADEELARDLYAAGVRSLGDEPGRPGLDLNVRLAVEGGDPVQVLAAVGREQAAALLVTGTRGRNALSSALLGSVSVGLVGRPAGRWR
jgi:nucleotide-binding universal stress UspA family protein